MKVYLPTATRHGDNDSDGRAFPVPAIPPIEGSRFAILTNGWEAMTPLADHLSRYLRQAGAVEVLVVERDKVGSGATRPAEDKFLDQLSRKIAGAITGLGN